MSHFYCRNCDRAGEFPNEGTARGEGWTEIETEGRAGPLALEYSALCPDCSS